MKTKTLGIFTLISFLFLCSCETPMLTRNLVIRAKGNIDIQSPLEKSFEACVKAVVKISDSKNNNTQPTIKEISQCKIAEINLDGSFDILINKVFNLSEGYDYEVKEVSLVNMSTKIYKDEKNNQYRKNRYYQKHSLSSEQDGELTQLLIDANFHYNGHSSFNNVNSIKAKIKLNGISQFENEARVCFNVKHATQLNSYEYKPLTESKKYCVESTIDSAGYTYPKMDVELFISDDIQNAITGLSVTTNKYNDGLLTSSKKRLKTYSSNTPISNLYFNENELNIESSLTFSQEKIVDQGDSNSEYSKACVNLVNKNAIKLCMRNRVPSSISRNCGLAAVSKRYGCIQAYLEGN